MMQPIVVVGPSSVGKSTLVERLLRDYPDRFGFSVSHTTRPPRQGETDGVQYHFVSKEKFNDMLSQGEFIEHVTYSGNMYGTSKYAVRQVHDQGKTCVLIIDVEGAKLFKAIPDFRGRYIFVVPPSMEELVRRMKTRCDKLDEEQITDRLRIASHELTYISDTNFWDMVLTNDNLETTYDAFVTFCM